MAASGTRLLVGAALQDAAGVDSGAAYVFVEAATGWELEQELLPAGLAAGARLGSAVAIDGDAAMVSSSGAGSAGIIHVFERGPGGWSETAQLTPSDPQAGKLFGYSLALDGGSLLVGAPGEALGIRTRVGSAYVFERGAGGWAQASKLVASNRGEGYLFGFAVALDGARALVGSPGYDLVDPGNFEDRGAAYAFERRSGGWSETQFLQPADPEIRADFGVLLSIDGDRALVGSSGSFSAEEPPAYVFERLGGSWHEVETILVQRGGAPIALAGDRVLIGESGHQAGFPGFNGPGAARLLRRVQGTWVETRRLIEDPARPDAVMGLALTLADGRAFLHVREPDGTSSVAVWELDCALEASPSMISLQHGGRVSVDLDAGPAHAGRVFWLLGTLGGTEPGIRARGVHIPLNLDGAGGYFLHTVRNPNRAPLVNSRGRLDGLGTARALFELLPRTDPALIGATVHHAFVAFDLTQGGAVFVSNPVHINLGF